MSDEAICAFRLGRAGTIRPHLPLPMPVCDECNSTATEQPQREVDEAPVRVDFLEAAVTIAQGGVPAAVGGPQCRDRGTPVQWFDTLNGKRIAMEAEAYPLSVIPYKSRWEITHGDTASPARGTTVDGYVRLCHFDVCPYRVRGTGPESARMRAIWKQNGGGF